jgi:hypothetical protein
MSTPKFDVQFQPPSGHVDAGRLATQGSRTVLRDKGDVTGYAVWAVVVPAAADEVSALTAAQFASPRCIRPSAPKGPRFARCS